MKIVITFLFIWLSQFQHVEYDTNGYPSHFGMTVLLTLCVFISTLLSYPFWYIKRYYMECILKATSFTSIFISLTLCYQDGIGYWYLLENYQDYRPIIAFSFGMIGAACYLIGLIRESIAENIKRLN